MFYYARSFGALLFSLFLLSSTLTAQIQSNQTQQSQQSGLGNLFYVDEAGLALIQTASPLDQFIEPDSYYLGPYDVISIQGAGLVEFSYRAIVVNASGDINAPLIGTVSLKGKSLTEAKEIIKDAFAGQIKDTEVTITLDQPRPVSVHIGGNIPNPGRYVVPAGTRYDALVTGIRVENLVITPLINQTAESILQATAQRPSYSGLNFDKLDAKEQSEAEIQNDELIKISQQYDLRYVKVTPLYGDEYFVDLAGYFNSGNPDFAPFIQDGDHVTLINASSDRATVSISGAVNNPFTGSFRADDTIEQLLDIAGGLSPDADSSSAIRIRPENGDFIRTELPISAVEKVQPGDQYIVRYRQTDSITGSVSIEGEVDLPGAFTIRNSETTIAQLLEMAGGLTEDALPNGAYLIRSAKDNRGVNSASSINLSLLSRSSDQFLEGYDYLEFEQALNPNRMAVDLTSATVLENTKLRNGDRIFIPKDENTISLLGQVNIPGFYNYEPTFSVQDYLSAANGLTIASDAERIFIIKAGSRAWYKPAETDLQSGDIIFVDRVPFEDVSTGRNFMLELERQKSERVRLIMTGIGTVASLITAYAAIRRLN